MKLSAAILALAGKEIIYLIFLEFEAIFRVKKFLSIRKFINVKNLEG